MVHVQALGWATTPPLPEAADQSGRMYGSSAGFKGLVVNSKDLECQGRQTLS